jgi:carbonic anhydrase
MDAVRVSPSAARCPYLTRVNSPPLVSVETAEDILPRYRGTPIESFLRYHNLGEPLPPTAGSASLLIGMCMDHRKDLTIPNEFAYVLRAAGGNLRGREFDVSYAISVGGVRALALLAHTDCGMAYLSEKREDFVRGLVESGGWTEREAEAHFEESRPRYEIGDPLAFVVGEAARLRQRYPGLLVAAFMYRVEDDRLAQVAET